MDKYLFKANIKYNSARSMEFVLETSDTVTIDRYFSTRWFWEVIISYYKDNFVTEILINIKYYFYSYYNI